MKWPDLIQLVKSDLNQKHLKQKLETKDSEAIKTISSFIGKHGQEYMLWPPVRNFFT